MSDLKLAHDLENGSPEELVTRLLADKTCSACVTCSFQAEDMIVVNLARQVRPDIAVVFLDTGYHFPETYAYRDRMTRSWGLKLVNLQAQDTVAEQESKLGVLYQSDPGRCCNLRKVVPLMEGLKEFDLWFTGLRREQSPTRKNLKVVEEHQLPSGKTLLKISPLAAWDLDQVWSYTLEHKIEYLPLYDLGYRSIGCQPCTSVPTEGAHPRSGRWGGAKLECGIHTFSKTAE